MKRQIVILALIGLFFVGLTNIAVAAPPPPGPKAAVQYEIPGMAKVLRAVDVMMEREYGAGSDDTWRAGYDGLYKIYRDKNKNRDLSVTMFWDGKYQIYSLETWSGKVIKVGIWEEILEYENK